jgi:hypothetical protein
VSWCLQVELEGLTGKIKFDTRGLRTDFELDIVELKKDGLQKVSHSRFLMVTLKSNQINNKFSIEMSTPRTHAIEKL